MHVLVLVIGDNVGAQLKPHLRKQIDFYDVGGRWADFLAKRGADGQVEHVASLHAGEIAWDEELAEMERRAREAFAEWKQIIDTHGRPKSRDELAPGLAEGEDVYAVYHEQPAMRAWNEAHPQSLYCPIYTFGFDEATYVRQIVDGRFVPFALVVNGEWIEGPMSLEATNPIWCAAINKRLRELPPDTLVTAVDCHM
jgi:hypothetical protein